jgi:alkaline phosphatase D
MPTLPSRCRALAFAGLCLVVASCARLMPGPPVIAPLPAETAPITRIAFGSCADQNSPQPFWEPMLATAPQLLLMLGDNVYGDVSSAEMAELKEAYRRLAEQPGFRRARERVPMLAVWDDHDYGVNDGGAEFAYRQEAQALFNQFWRVPAASPRARRPGIYESWAFGPKGQRLQIIALDTRYFRSRLKPTDQRDAPGKQRYVPDPDPAKTMLGDAQWAWLAEQLRQPADLRLIISSIQVLPDGHGFERWGNLPLERARLFRLIGETGARGVVFLSGDRHFGAIYQRTEDVPYPLFEITASGLNRPWREANEEDPLQLGPIFADANFGTIAIDWASGRVSLGVRDLRGGLVRSTTVELNELAPGYPPAS